MDFLDLLPALGAAAPAVALVLIFLRYLTVREEADRAERAEVRAGLAAERSETMSAIRELAASVDALRRELGEHHR